MATINRQRITVPHKHQTRYEAGALVHWYDNLCAQSWEAMLTAYCILAMPGLEGLGGNIRPDKYPYCARALS